MKEIFQTAGTKGTVIIMDNSKTLTDIIQNKLVETVFQPIVDLQSAVVFGYEAFSRGPEGTGFHKPLGLISEARCSNRIDELDSFLCENTLTHARDRGITSLLFVHFDPAYVLENRPAGSIAEKLGKYGMTPSQVVMEFTGSSEICRLDSFIDAADECRALGFPICFANVGPSYSSLTALSRMSPDYIKMDRDHITAIDSKADLQEHVRNEVIISKLLDAKLIAAGVETQQELKTLMSLGITAAQGLLIGQPCSKPQDISDGVRNAILSLRGGVQNS